MTPPEIDRLLAEDAWLRRLARSLTRDAAAAEDVVQDTWVAALASPAAARSPRGWLGGTLRNLVRQSARGEGRRAAREERAARREATSPTDEIVAELALRRDVTEALLELEEPYRTVLYRRFFGGESLKRIAAEQGVAVSTAHARLERGLQRMRARLDAEYGGDRRRWAVGLLSMCDPGFGATFTGGIAMGTAAKVAGAAVIVAGTVGWWLGTGVDERGSDAVAAGAEVERVAAPSREVPAVHGPSGGAERRAVEHAAGAPEPAPRVETVDVSGRIVDLGGHRLGGIPIEFESEDGDVTRSMRSAADGSFAMSVPLGTPLATEGFRLDDRDWQLVLSSHEHDYGDPTATLLLVVGPPLFFEGVVVDVEGAPVEGAAVTLRLRHDLFRDLGVKHAVGSTAERWKETTDADGRFSLERAVGGEHAFLEVASLGYENASRDLPAFDETGITVILQPLDEIRYVTGRVLAPEGAPFAGASVSLGAEIVESDADGRFRLKWDPDRLRGHVVAKDADGVWRPINRETHVAALAEGFAPARLELTEDIVAEPIVLRLGAAPLAIAGRVVDAAGDPIPGAQVWVRDPTHFGQQTHTTGESVARLSITLEEHLSGDRGTLVQDDGRFRLEGLTARDYDVQVYDPRTATYGTGWSLAAGTEGVVLRVDPDPSAARVAGRALSVGGEPHVGLRMRPVRPLGHGLDAQPPQDWSAAVETDEEGHFAFDSLALEGTRLELLGDDVFYHWVDLEGRARPDALELVVPLLCELRVTLRDARSADRLQVLDRDGEPLELLEHRGSFISALDEASLTDGKSSVLEVSELATSLRLLRDDEEVGRLPLAVVPGTRTEIEY